MLELAIILNMKQKKIMLFKLQKNGDFKKSMQNKVHGTSIKKNSWNNLKKLVIISVKSLNPWLVQSQTLYF